MDSTYEFPEDCWDQKVNVEDKCMDMATLGRPFQLGQLYDAKNENMVSGRILWDQQHIKNATNSIPLLQSSHRFFNQEDLKSKFEFFDVSPNLRLSILSGLTIPRGAAKFVNEYILQTNSNAQQSILHFQFVKEQQEIILDKLESVQYQQALQDTEATHIVTKIEYGIDAIFVFEQQILDEHEFQIDELWSKLQMFAELHGSTNFVRLDEILGMCTENEQNFISNVKCKVFTDLSIQGQQSFEVAVNLFYQLPMQAQKNQNYVRKVVLTPISKIIQYFRLDNSPQILGQQVLGDLVDEVEKVMTEYGCISLSISNLLKAPLVVKFSRLQKQVKEFVNIIKNSQLKFQEELRRTIMQIRSNNQEFQQLQNLLQNLPYLAYSPNTLSLYSAHCNQEIETTHIFLESELLSLLCSKQDLNQFKSEYEYVVCLELAVPSHDDNLIQYLQANNLNANKVNLNTEQLLTENEFDLDIFKDLILNSSWYNNNEITSSVSELIGVFKQSIKYVEENNIDNNETSIKFSIVDVHENSKSNYPQTISVYLNSQKISTGILSPPQGLQSTQKINNTQDELEWQHPDPQPTQYIVKYYPESDAQNILRKQVDGNQSTVRVDGLIQNAVYFFSICSQFIYGQSLYSPEIRVVPFPGKPRELRKIHQTTQNSIKLQWQPPEIGAQIIQHYLVCCKELGTSDKFQIVQSSNTEVQLSNLQQETLYLCQVKPVCQYGLRDFSQIIAKIQSENSLETFIGANKRIKSKIIVLGEASSGKTCIIQKKIEKNFTGRVAPTVTPCEVFSHEMYYENTSVKLNIWDTAGSERYYSLGTQYLRNATGIFLVYDITLSPTFERLRFWLEQAREYSRPNAVIILLGNKIDKQSSREISTAQGRRFADENSLLFVEVSATEDILIDEVYQLMLHSIVQKIKQGLFQDDILQQEAIVLLEAPPRQRSSSCCSQLKLLLL